MATKKKTSPAPTNSFSKTIIDGLKRKKGVFSTDPAILEKVASSLVALEGKSLQPAVKELVQLAQFLMVDQKSPAAGDSILKMLEGVVGIAGKKSAGWAKKK